MLAALLTLTYGIFSQAPMPTSGEKAIAIGAAPSFNSMLIVCALMVYGRVLALDPRGRAAPLASHCSRFANLAPFESYGLAAWLRTELAVIGYQVGFGPIAWLMISEVFPLRIRSTALSMAVTANFAGNVLVTFSLPSIQDAFDRLEPGKGIGWLFACYAVFCALSLVFTARYVPETKGKSLEQIEAELKS